ncbi:MAG: response regulator [Bacteroidota bacterium]
MLKVILIDDEPLARSLVKEYLQNHADVQIVQECNDGFEGIKAIQAHQPDLVFLDIQMPKLNGFEMLELIDHNPAIIFTTAFDDYALKAFEASAIDYLLKPFSKERFDRAVEKVKTQQAPNHETLLESLAKQPEESTRIAVKTNGNIVIVPISEVVYLEAYDDYVKIHTGQHIHVKKKTMAWYEKTLENTKFVRIHRSYLLNLDFLTRIAQTDKESYSAVLKNGHTLALSKNGYALLKERLEM